MVFARAWLGNLGRPVGLLLVLSLFCALFQVAVAGAAPISVGYTSSQALPIGAMVSSENQASGSVTPSDNQANNNLLGVVVANSTLAVSQGSNQVQVSSSGTAQVLVSDINGSVESGAKIGASPMSGIGMLATTSGKIVGIAQGALVANAGGAQYQTVTSTTGAQKKVLIGLIPVAINVTYYTANAPAGQQTIIPAYLREVAAFISGKQISTGRLLVALVVMMVGLLCVIVLIYGAVRSAIGAIGRNPLAKKAIQASMMRVFLLAAVILMAASGVVYVVLRG